MAASNSFRIVDNPTKNKATAKKTLVLAVIAVGLIGVVATSSIVIAVATTLNTQETQLGDAQKIGKRHAESTEITEMRAQIVHLTIALDAIISSKHMHIYAALTIEVSF